MGGSHASVRAWGSIFGALQVILLGKTVLALGGRSYACFLACLAFLCGAYLRMQVLFQPNMLDIFSWSLACYLLIRLIQTGAPKYLYGIALALVFGWYGKYSVVFVAAPIALAFLADAALRRWFTSRHLYFAAAGFLLLIAPNLYWQVSHGFPVMTHMKLLNEQLLVHVSRGQFIKEQLLFNLPALVVWMSGLIWLFTGRATKPYRPLLVVYFGILLFLMAMNGKGYYSMGIYPVLMAFGGVAIERWTSSKSPRHRVMRAGIPVLTVLLTLPFLPVMLPLAPPERLAKFYPRFGLEKTGVLTWERGDTHEIPQDFADMLGWKELAEKTAQVYHRLPDSVRSKTMIFGDQYAYAGVLNFYRKDFNLPETFSDDASFLFWLPKDFNYRHVILLDHHPRDPDDAVFSRFADFVVLDSMTHPYAREHGVKIMLYRNGDDSLSTIARKVIAAGKSAYRME
jgi:hypothetical protein